MSASLYSEVTQPHAHVYALPLGPPSHDPIPPAQVTTGHQAGLPGSQSSSPRAALHMMGSACQPRPPSAPPSPSHPAFTRPVSPSASLFLLWKQVQLYRFSRFHIHALIHGTCFSLSDLDVTPKYDTQKYKLIS